MTSPLAPIGAIQHALYDLLCGDATLVAMLAPTATGAPGITDTARPGAAYPRLEIGAFHAVPAHRYGPRSGPKYGWEVSGQVKGLSTYPGNAELHAIIARVTDLLTEPTTALTVTGFPDVACRVTDVGPEYTENVGSVLVRHLPVIVQVDVHEA